MVDNAERKCRYQGVALSTEFWCLAPSIEASLAKSLPVRHPASM